MRYVDNTKTDIIYTIELSESELRQVVAAMSAIDLEEAGEVLFGELYDVLHGVSAPRGRGLF